MNYKRKHIREEVEEDPWDWAKNNNIDDTVTYVINNLNLSVRRQLMVNVIQNGDIDSLIMIINKSHEDGIDVGHAGGYDEGYDLGRDVGYDEGYDSGIDNGIEEGHAEGYGEAEDEYKQSITDLEDELVETSKEYYEKGYHKGYNKGYDDGWEEGTYQEEPHDETMDMGYDDDEFGEDDDYLLNQQ